MIVFEDDITTIIPQRPPFVMIDQLVNCDEVCSGTNFLVKAGNVLVADGELSEAGLIENIAQTAAAGLGYISLKKNTPVVIGYIAAIKNLEIFALPKTGDKIETGVTIINQVFDVTIIAGEVKRGTTVLAKCEMKIALKK